MTSVSTQLESGLVLIDKPAGITSHDVVAKVRKTLGTRRVGHAGTLDPMATGLLVLGVNSGTKLLNYLTGSDKTYQATIRLGWGTTTDDAEGDRLLLPEAKPNQIESITTEIVRAELERFRGVQQQIPSSVSAVRIQGKRAYDLVRAGVEVELQPRTIEIHDIQLNGEVVHDSASSSAEFDITVSCSSGTYIRAIARDLGASLGIGGHLTALRRSQVGSFSLVDSSDLLTPVIIPLARAVSEIMQVTPVSDSEVHELRMGRKIQGKQDFSEGNFVAAIDSVGNLVAVAQSITGQLQPRWVLSEGK